MFRSRTAKTWWQPNKEKIWRTKKCNFDFGAKKFKIPAKSGFDLRGRPTFEQKNTKAGFLYFWRYRGEKGDRGENEVQEVVLWTKGMKDLSSNPFWLQGYFHLLVFKK